MAEIGQAVFTEGAVASAATCDIGATDEVNVEITGTATITSFGTAANKKRWGRFSGVLTLTHNGTSLILPGATNITTAAGDSFYARSDGSGNWRVHRYTRASGKALASPAFSEIADLALLPQGRLTLSTGVPVLAATVSGAGTVYYAPFVGRLVPVYNGTAFVLTDTGGELSQALSDTTKSPAAAANNSNYDLFVWSDSGTIRCTRGPAWSSDTARGTGAGTTELERVKGILVNKATITNGPAANRGTYVGSVRTNGSAQVDFILGAAASGGTAGSIGIWNAYNRRRLATMVQDSAASWTIAIGVNPTNASTAMRVSFLCGLQEDAFEASYVSNVAPAGGGAVVLFGVGYDSVSALSGAAAYLAAPSTNVQGRGEFASTALGWHFVQALEQGITATSTGIGSSTNALVWRGQF